MPRPETEQLAGWVLERLAGRAAPVVVDLGSGSGALALSIAQEHPGARVVAVERDAGAIEWTRHNAAVRAAAGDTPVEVLAGDMTDPELLRALEGTVDVVVSNPPYVPDGARVPREVAQPDGSTRTALSMTISSGSSNDAPKMVSIRITKEM